MAAMKAGHAQDLPDRPDVRRSPAPRSSDSPPTESTSSGPVHHGRPARRIHRGVRGIAATDDRSESDVGSRARARDARHHEALPGRRRQRPHRPRRPARRDPRPARRERRRQDDPDEHPVRARHARTRARSCSTAQPVKIAGPSDAIARGISMVHQHFMLVPVLTVAENILLGEETMANPIFLDRKEAQPADRRARPAVRLRDRSRRQGRLAVGRLAAAGRDPQGALPRRAGSSSSTSRRPS